MNTVEHRFLLDCYGSKGATIGAHDAFDIAPVAAPLTAAPCGPVPAAAES